MEADTGTNDSGASGSAASDSRNGSSSWLADTVNAAGDFLHQHGPYQAMNEQQQNAAQAPFHVLLGDGTTAHDATSAVVPQAVPRAPATPAANTPSPRPGPTNEQLAHAALVCGYTAKDAPRQMDDAALAQHFGVSPRVIAARPDDFYRRWVIKSTRELLPVAPSACRAILSDPHNAAQITPHLPGLATLNAAMNGVPSPGTPGDNPDASHLAKLRSRAGALLDGLYDAVGRGAHTIRNEFVGNLHGVIRASLFLPSQAGRGLDAATGGDTYEKWVLRQGAQAEKWLPDEDPDYRTVASNNLYAAVSGVGNGTTSGLDGATILAGAGPVTLDWLATRLTGKDHDAASNWWFSHTADNLQATEERLALDPNASFAEGVLHAAGSMAGMAPFILPTRGAGMPGFAGRAIHNATVVTPLAAINGVNAGNDTFAQTGDSEAAWKVAGISALTTELSAATLISLAGSRWFAAAHAPAKAATVTSATLATSEGSRLANNAVAPAEMQQGFSPENTVATLLTTMPPGSGARPRPRAQGAKAPNADTGEAPRPNPPVPAEPQPVHPGDAAATPNSPPQTGQAHVERASAELARATDAFDAAQFASELDRIAQAARADTLGKANPALHKNLVREMDAETGSPAVYAKRDEVLQALQQAGVSPGALQPALPEFHAQLQSQPVDGTVRFTRADLALHPELLEPVIPFARASEDAPNFVESIGQAQAHVEGVRQKVQARKEGNNRPPVDVSGKAVPASEPGVNTFNRKYIANYEKMKGNPEASDLEAANREAYAAELAGGRPKVETVYVGKEADRLVNGKGGKRKSADVVGVTSGGTYHVYEAGGSDFSPEKLKQLRCTGERLGPEKVLRQTLVMKEKITTSGYTVKNGVLMENGQPKLVNGKPVYVIFTTQGK